MDKENHIDKVYQVWREKNNIERKVTPPDFKKTIEQVASFFAPGSFYYYIFNFDNLTFDYVHPTVKEVLGLEPEEFNIEKFLSIHHPDDLKVFNEKEAVASEFLLDFLNPDDIPHYKVVYVNRVMHKDGHYIKLLHQAKALNVTERGKIQHVLGVHTDISFLNTRVDHKVSFIGDGKPSFYSVDPKNPQFSKIESIKLYSKQEIRIIQLIAEGKSSCEIAENLFITENTVKTHRKNILQKSDSKNTAHLVANCLREGLI